MKGGKSKDDGGDGGEEEEGGGDDDDEKVSSVACTKADRLYVVKLLLLDRKCRYIHMFECSISSIH